jgi:hypothetical protein
VPVCFFDDEVRAAGVIPASCIDAIAVVPGAGLPLTADGLLDLAAVRRYQRAAQDDAGFDDYLRTQVYARLPQAA